jgi:hypothetical protein
MPAASYPYALAHLPPAVRNLPVLQREKHTRSGYLTITFSRPEDAFLLTDFYPAKDEEPKPALKTPCAASTMFEKNQGWEHPVIHAPTLIYDHGKSSCIVHGR